ncbi:hypothetical protein AQUCO_01700595v1 [Aquilegia coerulea]|uniref:Protein ARV n=1 Tax=Aquilegia coerulea TaxID=218851 RepID=A0A2G5DNR5_AQUCA|nr:hypothetical protein AQUCO_01700595v1 [Aquilegia coerulea]
MEFKCVHCGFKMKLLFIQYSPGNIRLMKCENCKEVADEYIECEIMILLIDLILQKRKAYSHLLFNTRDNVDFEGILWKLGVLHLLVDSCKILLLKECKDYWGSSRSFELSFLVLGKVLLGVILSNLAFICTLFLSTRILLTSFTEITSFKSVLLAIVVSSYFKIFLMAMMVYGCLLLSCPGLILALYCDLFWYLFFPVHLFYFTFTSYRFGSFHLLCLMSLTYLSYHPMQWLLEL